MENIHLTPDDAENDDLYSGYDYRSIANELEEDPDFQRVIRTGYAQRPPMPTMHTSSQPPATGLRGFRPTTGVAPDVGQARPMTGVTAAKFTSTSKGLSFDPLSQSTAAKTAAGATEKSEGSPQEVIKKLERSVNLLIEESAQASAIGDVQTALDKAKEAARKERMLCKQREQAQLTDQINFDLTYCVLFNLGTQYHACRNYSDALNTYLLIVKNKMFNTAGRLRVNMGNIYMEQGKYPEAIKMYRMALDQISDIHRDVRFKIMQNIGTVFVCMGRYADAITSFETIMEDQANFKTALNLMLCYYAISDREKLKKTFQRTLQISTGIEDEDRYYPTVDDDPHQRLLIEAIKDDSLRKIEKARKAEAEKTILTAAKLIAPVIESSFAVGFDWCIERVKESLYGELASELEITKALTFLKQNDISQAIETFKECGKKDNKMAGTAATNLSFVYFMEDSVQQADKHADTAISLDRYNPYALVNKGCCLYRSQQYEKAGEYFREALSVEATCSSALYNLGLVHKKLGRTQEALESFLKLHTILKNSPLILWHLADLHDKMDNFDQATEWFMQVATLVPTDPKVLQRLGEMYDDNGDQSQAFQYHYESFRYCPTSIEVISWLGAYYMETQFADKAIHYFERAALIQPTQINWQLMVASCYRKIGNYQQALQCYKEIHKKFPENVDCLKFLVKLCSDLGLKESQEYSLKLRKAEKLQEAKRQRELSSGSRKSSGGSVKAGSSRKQQDTQNLFPPPLPISGGSGDRIASGGSDSWSGGGSARRKEIDANYTDPLGDLPQRPKTSSKRQQEEDEFQNAELDDNLLPE